MNLYELAHHPDAWKDKNKRLAWSWIDCATDDQFRFLNETDKWGDTISTNTPVSMHTDENEYRMHLLFAHWAMCADAHSNSEKEPSNENL